MLDVHAADNANTALIVSVLLCEHLKSERAGMRSVQSCKRSMTELRFVLIAGKIVLPGVNFMLDLELEW